jgi:hypothetical protein
MIKALAGGWRQQRDWSIGKKEEAIIEMSSAFITEK